MDFEALMTFIKAIAIQMLQGATNAPQPTEQDNGATLEPQNVWQLDYVDSVGVLKDPFSDCLFYILQPVNARIAEQIDIVTNGSADPTLVNQTVQYVRPLKITFECYGPNAFEWSDTLRVMLMNRNILDQFATHGLSLVLPIPIPVYSPEKINAQWYKRYDVSAVFNQLITVNEDIPAFSAGEVILMDEKGVIN